DAAGILLVQFAPPALADVGLRSPHFAVGQLFGAELDAAVLRVRHEPDFDRKAEVSGGHLAPQKLVALQAGAAADDDTVLDLPQPRVAVPAGEILAVKKVFDVLFRRQERRLHRAL